MNAISTVWASLKAATARLTMHWSRGESWGLTWLTGTAYDYQKAAGDGRTNAAVMCCVRFVQRALPESPLIVVLRNADGEMTPAPEHPLQALIERPNDHYSGLHLIGALVADLMLTGNAYLLKVRSGAGRPVALWWVPSTMIEPRWNDDGTEFIGWYEYTVDGIINRIDQHDVVHIRQGFDPRNIRKGLSDLECLFREIATDNEAAQMSATLLRNQAVPGVILSPEGDKNTPSQADVEAAKNNFMSKFGGDRRGEPMVMQGPTKVSVLSWSPEQMNLRSLRQIPEERITAVFGIPAAVVGLGTGLEQTKVGATMSESREQAYESCLIPLQRLMMAELQMQLVPDFGDPARLRVQFDLKEVRVLQDDQNALHERARADLLGGLLTLNQALTMIGEEPVDGEGGDVRYVPNTVTVKTTDTLIPEPMPAALAAPTPLRMLPAPAEEDAKPPAAATAGGKMGGWGAPLTQQLPGTATASASTGRPSEYSRTEDEPAAGKGDIPSTLKAAALSDDDLLARYEAGLSLLSEDLADDLLGAFEAMVDTVAGRAMSHLKAAGSLADGAVAAEIVHGTDQHRALQGAIGLGQGGGGSDAMHVASGAQHRQDGGVESAGALVGRGSVDGQHADSIDRKAALISGLVTSADHAEIRSLLRSGILKSMRQAAEDLSPLLDTPVRITRASPAYKAAVAEMEARLPGIIETTGADFSRLVVRLERRPGSVPLADVRAALTEYIADTYPGRAENIAATELGYAHALGVIHVAEKSGIATRVHVSDGDGDAACVARNGTTATLEEARGIGLLHPNCRLRLLVIVEAAAAA